MSLSLQQLKDAVLDLPESQRAELVQYLLDFLDERNEHGAQAAWLVLAEQRMAEVRAGKVVGIPAEQVLKSLLPPGQ